MNYDWSFARLAPYWKAFAAGTMVTLELTAIVILVGTLLGVSLGFIATRRVGKVVSYPIIDILRALPPLVLILFMYYLLTRQVIGVTVPAFWVAAAAMSLNLAAFTADLVRSAIENVPHGVVEAGRALGMSGRQLTIHIVMPHIARELMPAMTALYIGMLKVSSLASVINVREVVYTAQTVIADISRSLEAWIVVGLIYVVLVVPSTYALRKLERWNNQTRPGQEHA